MPTREQRAPARWPEQEWAFGMRRIIAVSILATVAGALAFAPPAAANPSDEARFVALINQERAARGLVTLAVSGDLVDYARRHSTLMADQRSLHHSSGLNTLSNWRMLGENVGRGGSVQALHDAFMASPSHRENVLRSNFRQAGVGVVVRDGTIWVTVVFREPEVMPASPAPGGGDPVVGIAATPSGSGYWLARASGSVEPSGDAGHHGDARGLTPVPVIDISSTPSGGGYWLMDQAGGVFTFGDGRYLGSLPGLRASGSPIGPAEVVALASTPSGGGYWILDSAGGMFAFGDARFFGSLPGLRASGVPIGPADVIAMVPTPSGGGYWILDSAGGMFAFGDARFFGSLPGLRQAGYRIGVVDVVSMHPTPSGGGYWLLDQVGGLFAFGDARYHGSMPAIGAPGPAVEMVPVNGDAGYLIATAGGAVHHFGA